MRIHYIQHASFEPVGVVKDWADIHRHEISGTRTDLNEHLPGADQFDFLIIMGGPQSPLKLDEFPYLRDEIHLIREAAHAGKIILGFCLGAQLIGEALGAKTERSPEKEVGIFPIELTEEGLKDPIFQGFSKSFPVIHWHNDMPGLPDGARLLATSNGCPRQGFAVGDRIYGFQFHMEITYDMASHLIEKCPEDLSPSLYTQSKEDILNSDFKSINEEMKIVLDRLAVTYQEGNSV